MTLLLQYAFLKFSASGMTCFETRLGCLDADKDSHQQKMIEANGAIFSLSPEAKIHNSTLQVYFNPNMEEAGRSRRLLFWVRKIKLSCNWLTFYQLSLLEIICLSSTIALTENPETENVSLLLQTDNHQSSNFILLHCTSSSLSVIHYFFGSNNVSYSRNGQKLVDQTVKKIEELTNQGKLEDGQYGFLTYLLSKKELSYKDLSIITLSLFGDGLSTVRRSSPFSLLVYLYWVKSGQGRELGLNGLHKTLWKVSHCTFTSAEGAGAYCPPCPSPGSLPLPQFRPM